MVWSEFHFDKDTVAATEGINCRRSRVRARDLPAPPRPMCSHPRRPHPHAAHALISMVQSLFEFVMTRNLLCVKRRTGRFLKRARLPLREWFIIRGFRAPTVAPLEGEPGPWTPSLKNKASSLGSFHSLTKNSQDIAPLSPALLRYCKWPSKAGTHLPPPTSHLRPVPGFPEPQVPRLGKHAHLAGLIKLRG